MQVYRSLVSRAGTRRQPSQRWHTTRPTATTHRRYRQNGVVDEAEWAKNRTKTKVRAKVEHAIGVIKRVFGFVKVRSIAHWSVLVGSSLCICHRPTLLLGIDAHDRTESRTASKSIPA
jgi:hypothetical protein